MKLLQTNSNDRVATFLRLILAVVMFPHGAQKALGWFGGHGFSETIEFFTSQGIPVFLGFLAILAEFAGSIGLLFGLLTRIAAFGIAVNMSVAILSVHLKNGFFMNWAGNQAGEGFEYHILALGVAIAIIVRGGGAISIDSKVN